MSGHTLILWLKMYISFLGKVLSYVVPLIIPILIGAVTWLLHAPIYWLILAIVLVIPAAFLITKLHQIIVEDTVVIDTIIDAIKRDLGKQSDTIPDRPGRMFPDTPLPNLPPYASAIASIRTKRYLEFTNCQNIAGLDYKGKKQLVLQTMTPGMHKYYMVLSEKEDLHDGRYMIIHAPDDAGIDNRDFTETWFNRIFPIIGHLSSSVSEKLASSFPGSNGFYVISRFRIVPKGGYLSLRIYV